MIGCQMTMDVFGFSKDEFIDECEIGGAATFLEFAADADVSLFVQADFDVSRFAKVSASHNIPQSGKI